MRRRTQITIEVVVVVVLIAVVGVTGFVALQTRTSSKNTEEVEVALHRAALAAETLASEHDGDYSTLHDMDEEDLEASGYESPGDVILGIEATTADSYCITATHQGEAGEWSTATISSAAEAAESDDDC